LTHTIIQPTTDKRTDAKVLGNKVTVRKVGETREGIIVRGVRVLATLVPFADEQTVYLVEAAAAIAFGVANAQQTEFTPAGEHIARQSFILLRCCDQPLMFRPTQAPDRIPHGDMLFREREVHDQPIFLIANYLPMEK